MDTPIADRSRAPFSIAALALILVGCPPPEDTPVPLEAVPGWTTLAPLPEARTEVSVTSDGERIYLAGGFVPPDNGGAEERPPVGEDLWVYDPLLNQWWSLGAIPAGTHHAGFVHVDGRLYLVGGYRDNTFDPVDQVWIYDIDAGAWSEGTPMPTPRGGLAYAVLDGRIHTVGGTVADKGALESEAHNTDSPDASVGTHEVYDPALDRWERLAPMPTARNHHAAEVAGGRLYVTSGRAGNDFTMTVTEAYDPATDRWEEVAPLPTGRSGVAAAEWDGWIYVFGGETFDPDMARTFDDTERYDPREDRWEVLDPMPTARHGLGAGVVDGMIYVISGGPQPGFSFGTSNERYVP
ncbi:MAG: galactose oxidase [Gemmatimonadales bacterium]|nr:MAG: galactose oxidase [Gemmatimonadales bacterium]